MIQTAVAKEKKENSMIKVTLDKYAITTYISYWLRAWNNFTVYHDVSVKFDKRY